MPDPLLYLQAAGGAAVTSVVLVLVFRGIAFRAAAPVGGAALTVGAGAGVLAGLAILGLLPRWPPVSALDRLLDVLLPAVVAIEVAAAAAKVSRVVPLLLRTAVVLGSGRILLHGSGYLLPDGEWSAWQLAAVLCACQVLFATLWSSLLWLHARAPGISLPLTLAMAVQCAGLLVMLAGYLKGGAVTFPLAAALAGTAVAACSRRSHSELQGLLGLGAAGLFGALFIGRFFGGLNTPTAVVVLLSPLLAWAAELPGIRRRRPWQVAAIRLGLVACPLALVLMLAKRDFDREMAPLIGQAGPARNYTP